MAAPLDVAAVKAKLSEAGALASEVYNANFGHMDFIWDPSAKDTVYRSVLDILGRYVPYSLSGQRKHHRLC